MSILAKCNNCHQFNRHADSENDIICSRCKKAINKGLTQLPDEKLTNVSTRKPTTDEENLVKSGSSN